MGFWKLARVGAALLGGAVLLCGCGGKENISESSVPVYTGGAVSSSDVSSSSAVSSSSESAESSEISEVIESTESSESLESDENSDENYEEDEEIPVEIVSGIHANNYIYNPNVTDKSNKARYNAEFSWGGGEAALWENDFREKPFGEYDSEAAVSYAKAHWNDGEGLCAEFLSKCLLAGGITEFTASSTSIALQLLHSGLGFGQFLAYDKNDHTIPLPSYARAGDVVQIYCSYEGGMIHSLLVAGTDGEGRLRAYCHNLRNSGKNTYHIDYLNDPCYDCGSETAEIFFYHFYRDDDENLPKAVVLNKNIVLWEENGYFISGQEYDREAALSFAETHQKDGFGAFGAVHSSEILARGGIAVGYPNQSALFLQLLKSRLGEAFSVKVRANRTVKMPESAKAGDLGFIYCPKDGIIISSFIISGSDENGLLKAFSFDKLNNGESAFKTDSFCPGCGSEIYEVIVYEFY